MNIMMSKKKMTAEVVRMYAHNVLVEADAGEYEHALKCIEDMRRYVYRAKEDKRKVKLTMELNAHSIKGKVPVLVYSMDCDLCEGTNLTWIPCDTNEYDKLVSDMERSAEGPWNLTMLTEEEARKFVPRTRDIAAEQAGY